MFTIVRSARIAFGVLSFVLGAVSGALAQATPALDVHVTDALGAPVPAARITVSSPAGGPTHMAITNDAGVARFAFVSDGDYLVAVEAQGFTRQKLTPVSLLVGRPRVVSVSLSLKGFSDVVVVTASGTAQNLDGLSKAASVVTRRDMDERGDRTIAEAVRLLPGVRIQQFGGPGAAAAINIRGMRSEDTAILVDGVRFRDAGATQGEAGTFVSDLLVTNPDRVEVLRGSGSSLYGSHAIGGVLNVITRPGAGPPSGSVRLEAGALGTWQMRGHVGGGLLADRVSYSLGAARLTVADGLDGDDAADNTSAQGEVAVILTDRARVSARFYGADASTMVNEGPTAIGGLPPSGVVVARPLPTAELRRYEAGTPIEGLEVGEATFIPSANDADSRRTSRFRSTLFQLSHQPSARAGYRIFYHAVDTSRRFDDGPLGVSGFEPAQRNVADFRGDIDTLGARADVQLGAAQLVTAGYELERERYSSEASATTGAAASTVDVIEHSHTAFIQDQISVTKALQVSGAFRVQQFSLSTPRLTPADRPPFQDVAFDAPPAAVTADVSAVFSGLGPDTRIRVHGGTGYRAPSLFERYGTSFGRRGYSIYGDPRLPPERAVTLDAGVDRHFASRHVRLAATGFGVWLDDVIVFDFSGGIDPAIDPFGRSSGYRTSAGASSRGVELQITASPSARTHLEGSYTFADAEPRTTGPVELTRAAAIPRHQVSVSATHQFGRRLHVNLDLLAASAHLATLSDPVTFATRVFEFPGTRRVNLAVVCQFPLAGRAHLELFGRIDGLFGAARYESGFRTPGRYVTAGVGVEF